MPENINLGEMPEKDFLNNTPIAPVKKSELSEGAAAGGFELDKKAPNFAKNNTECEMREDRQITLGEKIRQELRLLPKIDSDNSEETIKQVREKLNIQSEADIRELEAKVGVRANIFRNLERIKMLDKEDQKEVYRKFATEDAEWMQKTGEYIKFINNDKALLKMVNLRSF